jgi:hypothetical protein
LLIGRLLNHFGTGGLILPDIASRSWVAKMGRCPRQPRRSLGVDMLIVGWA